MLGAATLELVRDAVRVKAVKPRKKTPLPAFRLLELVAGAPPVARYLEAQLVGREDELQRLLRRLRGSQSASRRRRSWPSSASPASARRASPTS